MAKAMTTARLKVRYGKFREGETIRGDLADQLIADDMATDITPKPKKAKAKKATKAKGPAPENKADGFDPEG